METVDLICHDELMPRIKLLAKHMQTLGVELHLHTAPPDPCPPRLVIAPTLRHPVSVEGIRTNELIAIYLEDDTPTVAAHYRIDIPAWPARSSDPDVARLAAHLIAKPVGAEPTNSAAAKDHEAQKSRVFHINSERVRSGMTLIAIIAVFAALFSGLLTQEDTAVTRETLPNDIQMSVSSTEASQTSVPVAVVEPAITAQLPTSEPLPWLTQRCPVSSEAMQLAPRENQSCRPCAAMVD